MSIKALTNKGCYIGLEALPSFCVIRAEIIQNDESVPVGNDYINQDKLYMYAWSAEQKFYIFIKGVACEANCIDFDFPLLNEISEYKKEFVA
ncbi:hypothetical protein [Fangia hongkongensis]|uniref:hypothetical protein n=1 Tax=Fangia hongkongensis TaxID=270495 RepID=UPI0003760387|nr:hypothetical protein [Fangia hongkongensis]MBK2125284.1 hypothetical protein [Fangia hongkongensis]